MNPSRRPVPAGDTTWVLPAKARELKLSHPEPRPPANCSRWFADEVQPHEFKLRAWLHARFPSLADSDDIVQESYMRLLRARASRPINNPKGYLFATALNIALDLFRRGSVVRIESVGDFERLPVCEERPQANETVSRDEELQVLREAVEALPTRCRQVFTLRKLYGLSHREISAQLHISGKTVETHVSRAMRRCAAFLHRRGLP